MMMAMMLMMFARATVFLAAIMGTCNAFTTTPLYTKNIARLSSMHAAEAASQAEGEDSNSRSRKNYARRDILVQSLVTALTVGGSRVMPAFAADDGAAIPAPAPLPEITAKLYIDVKAPTDSESSRIVIGLFGKSAPTSTLKLQQLVSSQGLPSPCKPRDTSRTLQKEQLEANKVYNGCIESEQRGVTYEYGTVWRIVQNSFINVGSVSGKYISREFPNWSDAADDSGNRQIPIAFGTVSVLKGNDSGFGFTIHTNPTPISNDDGSVICVGTVLEGSDVVERLNHTPVITSSKIGSGDLRAAPSRSCAYGKKELYCNEFKPLQKLTIVGSGVL